MSRRDGWYGRCVQDRWFGDGFGSDQISMLKSLPIFKLGAGAAPADGAQRAEPAFTSLGEACQLAPPGTDPALLGPHFLVQPLLGEAEVMRQRLGVQQISHTQYFLEHIFPR